MTESRTLGGTCVNRGCLPSKNLIEAARIIWEVQHPRYAGLRPARVEVDFAELVRQKDTVVQNFRDRKYNSIVDDADLIRVYDGHASFLGPHEVAVDRRVIEGDQVLIATGTRPAAPDIQGLDEAPYITSDLLTSDEAEELFELPQSLVIIGGGYIALELGQMFHRFGARPERALRLGVRLHRRGVIVDVRLCGMVALFVVQAAIVAVVSSVIAPAGEPMAS